MADVAALLQTMRAFREPPPPAPVLPYLAMSAIGVAAAIGGGTVAIMAARRHAGLRRSAQAALAASRRLSPAERLTAQASLLRRLVRSLRGDAEAREQGASWLEALDRVFGTDFFTAGPGQAYGEALYRPVPEASLADEVETLDRSLAALIRAVRA